MGVVDEAVEDGVGEGGLIDVGVPFRDGQLTGDDGGGLAIAIVEDFEEIAFYLIAERREAKVVDDQELYLGEAPEESAFLLESLCFGEFVHEARETEISNREVLAARSVGEGAGDVALPHAGGAADEDIESLLDPAEVYEPGPEPAVDTSGGALIDILDGGVLGQLGPAQTLGQAIAEPLHSLVIEKEPQALIEGHGLEVGALALLFEGSGHAAKTEILKGLIQRLSQHAASWKYSAPRMFSCSMDGGGTGFLGLGARRNPWRAR